MSELPRGWATATVGEIADLADGPFGSNLKTAHYTEDGPRVVRLQNIGEGTFRDEHAHISQDHYERLAKHSVCEGDVIVASLGENAPRACRVPSWLGPAIVKADCIRTRPVTGVVPSFLMWMLNSPPVRAQAAASIKGIGRPRLGLGGIRNLVVPVPPTAEQQRVVAAIEEHLSRLDAADASLQRARLMINQMQRAVLTSSLRDGWPKVALAEVADVRLGRQRSPKNHFGPNMTPYLRAANVTWKGLHLADVKQMHFSSAEVETYELRDGDLLLAEASGSASEVGKPAIWHNEIPGCCFQNTVIRVRSRGPLSDFLRVVFLAAARNGEFARAAPGVGIHHLGADRLSKWQVPVPPPAHQKRIVAEVERQLSLVDSLAAAVDASLARSAALRRAILERAFNGKLVSQDPTDESAPVLLKRIRAERESELAMQQSRRRSRGRERRSSDRGGRTKAG